MTNRTTSRRSTSKRQLHTRSTLDLLSTALNLVLALLAFFSIPVTSARSSSSSPTESLTETLLLKPLPDGRVLSSFEFTLTSTSSSTSSFRLLPRTLLQPIQHFGVNEVHLSLNSGRWRYKDWGSPVTLLKRRSTYVDADDKQNHFKNIGLYGPSHASSKSDNFKIGEEAVGSGGELLARFETLAAQQHDTDPSLDQRWKGLTSALAGLFCASLDAIDERHTVHPHHAYLSHLSPTNETQTVHALLPTEGVCTENLTPLLKLLPCKNAAGLATLLNPLSLFSANFQGLGVQVKKLPSVLSGLGKAQEGGEGGGKGEGGWEVRLTFTAVFSPAVTRDVGVRDWSIRSLFGRSLHSACPLADSSSIRVLKPIHVQGGAKYVINPLPAFPECARPGEKGCGKERKDLFLPVLSEEDEVTNELARSGLLAWDTEEEAQEYEQRLLTRWGHYLDTVDGEYIYDVLTMFNATKIENTTNSTTMTPTKGETQLDINMSWPHETRFNYPHAGNHTVSGQVVHVDRALIGSGQERAELRVTLTNTDDKVAMRVLWYETLGYFIKPYLHTLKQQVQFLASSQSNSKREEDELFRSIDDFGNPVEELSYQSTTTTGKRASRRPFVLEGIVRIPARSKVVLTMEIKKEFIPYSQHPPDAHRGFDLAPSIVFPLAPLDPREPLLNARKRDASRSHNRDGTIESPSYSPPILPHLLDILKQSAPASQAHETTSTTNQTTNSTSTELCKSQSRIYSLPRLVELATPDFSFVYTNIIFTSTVIALFFGSCLNTLLRTFTDIII